LAVEESGGGGAGAREAPDVHRSSEMWLSKTGSQNWLKIASDPARPILVGQLVIRTRACGAINTRLRGLVSPTILLSMIDSVAQNLDRIRTVCKVHGVSFLDLVRSAARSDFDSSRSDIDVLVDFPDGATNLFGSFMGLREDLADILGRPVDVITVRGVRNQQLLESLRRDAVRLYAA
jgi:uncharacterized protein